MANGLFRSRFPWCDGIVRVTPMPFDMMVSCVICTLTTVPFLLLNTLYIVEGTVTHERAHTKKYKVSVR